MQNSWSLVLSLVWITPWLVIAIVALLATLKKKQSVPLVLQLLGAAGMILALPAREVAVILITAAHAPFQAVTATYTIFGFLTYSLLLIFAVGYAWEKLARR